MAEEENKKKGRLATAVLAGSALALSSFAIGAPAALAQTEESPEPSASIESPSPTPESDETPEVEAPTGESETADASEDESNQGDAQSGDAGEDDKSSDEPAPLATEKVTETPQVDDDETSQVETFQQQPDAGVYLNPGAGPAGTTVTFNGFNFSPNVEVEISMEHADGGASIPVDPVTTSDIGGFEVSIPVPDDAVSGVYSITAVDSEADVTETADFNVTNATLTVDPETITEEDFRESGVTHTVDGLEEGDEVQFSVGNAFNPMEHLSGTAVANAEGVAEYTVQETGDSIYVGGYNTTVSYADGGAQIASGNFEVTSEEPQVSLSASQVAQGGSIFVSGYNFTPETDVTLTWGPNAETIDLQADETGSIHHELVIPEDTEPGTNDLVVTDETSGESTTHELTVTDGDESETPAVDPEITLDTNEAYQGEVIVASGSGFTPNSDVVLGLEDSVTTVVADENGEIADSAIRVPSDLPEGSYDFTALDVESGEEATADFTVLEATEPMLRISPEEITLGDFIRGADEDEGGVVHTVVGLEPGTELDAVIDGPENVQTIERDETVDEHGIAEFVIYGYDISDPTNYLGVYDSSITIVDAEGEPLEGSFEVVEGAQTNPEIDLNVDNAYPGDTVSVSGSGFTEDGDVEFSINPPVGDTVANADGEFNAEVTIPEDLEPGEHTFTALDVESGEEATADFTVNDPADQVTEPALSIDPERIELDDFIGDEDDDNGVVHTVVGLEAGADYTYAVSGPEGVNDFEQSGTANEDGVAEFVIHGYEVSNPAVYLGDYTTVVNSVDQDGTDVELTGNFSVVSDDGSAGDGSGPDGSGDYTGDPVDMNGSALAQTGATSGQLGLIAGALLLMGGAFVVFANRGRLFGRKH